MERIDDNLYIQVEREKRQQRERERGVVPALVEAVSAADVTITPPNFIDNEYVRANGKHLVMIRRIGPAECLWCGDNYSLRGPRVHDGCCSPECSAEYGAWVKRRNTE